MHVYVFHSRLFQTPRIITSNFPIQIEDLENFVNLDNEYLEVSRWKYVELPLYPIPVESK